MDDVRQQLARDLPVALRHRARQLDDVGGVHQRLVGAPVALLEALGVPLSDPQSVDDIARHIVAAERDRAKVADLALMEECQVGGAGTHLDERDSQLFFVFGEHRQRAGERLQDQFAHGVARALHRLAQVERGGTADGHQVHLGFETRTRHADRVTNARVLVHRIFLGQRVQELAFGGDRHGLRDFIGALHVGPGDLFATDGDDALADHRLHVLAGDPGVHVMHLHARHALGVLDGFADRARSLLDVSYHAAAHARGAGLADAQHLHHRMLGEIADHLADDGGGLGRADVQPGNEAIGVHWKRAMTWSR